MKGTHAKWLIAASILVVVLTPLSAAAWSMRDISRTIDGQSTVVRAYPRTYNRQIRGWIERGDYESLVNHYVRRRGGDAQFNVAYFKMLWALDSAPLTPPAHTGTDALAALRESAQRGHRMAAAMLRQGYTEGLYGLAVDDERAACWQRVEWGELDADACD